MSNFSENLKFIRKQNRISQEDLAEKLNVSRQSISKWESDLSYPEMDKIIQISNMFGFTIDELLNSNVSEVDKEQKQVKSFNNYYEDFMEFISNSTKLFVSMTLKTKIKFIIEEIVVSLLLFILLLIVGTIGNYAINTIFGGSILYGIIRGLKGLYIIAAFVFAIIVIIKIYKTRYLDYYLSINVDDGKSSENLEENKQNKIEKINKKIELKNTPSKIVIRDPKNSEYSFIKGLAKILLIVIKFFAIFGIVFLSIGLILAVGGLICSFLISKSGLFFVGAIFGLIGVSTLIILALILFINFVINRKSNKKQMIITFFISLLLIGIGLGFLIVGFTKFTQIHSNDLLEKETIEIPMEDNLYFNYENVEYIEKDINNIEIEFEINSFETGNYYITKNGQVRLNSYVKDNFENVRKYLKLFNEKKFIYSIDDQIFNIKVYSSKDNLLKLKENYNKVNIK